MARWMPTARQVQPEPSPTVWPSLHSPCSGCEYHSPKCVNLRRQQRPADQRHRKGMSRCCCSHHVAAASSAAVGAVLGDGGDQAQNEALDTSDMLYPIGGSIFCPSGRVCTACPAHLGTSLTRIVP